MVREQPRQLTHSTAPLAPDGQRRWADSVKARLKVGAVLLVLTAGLVALPAVSYALENRQLGAERARVHSLIRVGQTIGEAQAALAQRGFRFHGDVPTRFISYQQLLVIIGDTKPSMLDTVFYVVGGPNPLRTQSPYVVIAASLDGVVTAIE